MLSPSTQLLVQELNRRGYETIFFDDPYLVKVNKDGKSCFIHASKTPKQSAAAFFLCKDKFLTKQVLDLYNFPTSRAIKINTTTIHLADELVFPVVVKPLRESGGKGVVLGVKSKEEIQKYFDLNSAMNEVIVEESLEGEDTRVLIIQGKYFAACVRKPAYVLGDGKSTIQELITKENEQRKRIIDEQLSAGIITSNTHLILVDQEINKALEQQNITLNTIASEGEEILVRRNANVSTGGVSIDVTDKVCSEIKTLCEKIAEALCVQTLGIDIMTKDLDCPLNIKEKSGIIEINASPMLTLHSLADVGTRRDPVPLLVDEIEDYLLNIT